MIAYPEKTTSELIDLLFEEEDRVTLEHIKELVGRPDAIEKLREFLRSEYYWYEGEWGEWWILYHAFTILSATRDPEFLPDVLNALEMAYEAQYDWIQEIGSAALSHFGEPAVEPLMRYVSEHRDSHEEDEDFTYLRSIAVTALTRIGLRHPASREKIAGFVCSLLTDPNETDPAFLGFVTDDALILDRERGELAVKNAFDRDAVDEFISGDFKETIDFFDRRKRSESWEYTQDLFEFYRPEEIAKRQARWKKEEEDQMRADAKAKTREEAQRSERIYQPPDPFTIDDEGNVVRRQKIGRNDPCPCGSGKKYKKCCGM